MASTFKMVIFVMLVLLSMAGCGGSGSDPGSVTDPFAQNQPTDNGNITPSGNGTVLNYSMSLSTVGSSGGTTVGSNSSIIATATLKDSNGKAVASQPILFEEVIPTAGDTASVTIPVPVVSTSSEGKAITFLTANNTTDNKDVIIKASTSINGQEVNAISIFSVARSTGNYIHFITSRDPSDPEGNLNLLKATIVDIDPATVPNYGILQLVTLEVLDKDGVKRTGVPVKLEIINAMGNCTAVYLGSEGTTTQVLTTDNTGLDVFSASVILPTPPIGSTSSCSIIYKATTEDPYQPGTDLFSYGGFIATLENQKQ